MKAAFNDIHTQSTIEREASCNAAEWDAYVREHPEGSFFHLAGWSVAVKKSYDYETVYLSARRNGKLSGVLALTDARTPFLGRSLISTAFSVGGGPLADDEDTLMRLLAAAEGLGKEKNARYVECRSEFHAPNWLSKSGLHANFSAPLEVDENQALSSIPRKRRAELRKAIDAARAGELTVRHEGGADIFYKLYAQSLHKLGTPVYPKRFLTALLDEFSQHAEISVVEFKGEPVAALISFYFADTVLPYYVGASDAAREARAFDYLYWAVMRRAANKGFATFDFGRSKINSGAYHYKKLWGFEPRPVTYQVKLIGAKALPEVHAANPKFALFSKLWPHLPAFAANRIGPYLAPNFP